MSKIRFLTIAFLLFAFNALVKADGLNCDSLTVTPNYFTNAAGNNCCFSFDFENNSGIPLSKICVDINTPLWNFSSGTVVLDAGYNLISSTTTSLCIDHGTTGIPMGDLTGVVEFCMDDLGPAASLPQHLIFSWYSSPQQIVCMDSVYVDCQSSPNTPPCGWAAATCYAGSAAEPVGVIYDVSLNSTAPNGDDWVPTIPAEIHPANWMRDSIGQVFGIAWDAAYNVYLAASDLYRLDGPIFTSNTGPAGTAGIYKAGSVDGYLAHPFVTTVNSASMNTTGTNQIPNTGGIGNGIGNIAYDVDFDQFFATNLEDGRIYRISNTGIVLSIYDPFSLDNGTSGMSNPQDRLWGVGVHTQSGVRKVFFTREKSGSNNKEIWSIALTAAGEFDNTGGTAPGGIMTGSTLENLEIDVNIGNMVKLTDIALSFGGNIIMSERGHPHDAQVLEYEFDGTNWNYLRMYFVGWSAGGRNAAGGVDYGYAESMGDIRADCDGLVWANAYNSRPTFLVGSPGRSYGMCGMSSMGNASHPSNSTTDIFLDFDGVYNYGDKRQLGDVEIAKCGCPPAPGLNCDSLMVMPRSNNIDPTINTCCWSMDFKNNAGVDISKICVDINTADWIFNTGSLVLDGAYTWETNTSTQICFEHPGAIPAGMLNGILEFCLIETDPSATSPQELIFSWFSGPQHVLCTDTLLLDCQPVIVEDPCLTLTNFQVACTQGNDSEYCVSFDVINNSSFAAYSLILENLPAGFTFGDCGCGGSPYGVGMLDYAFDWFTTPLAAGDSRSMCVKIISGSPVLTPTNLCINGSLEGLIQCCSSPEDYCFTLEKCCDPCESTSISSKAIVGDECCYALSPSFGCTFDYFTKIEFNILTPDVVFGSHFLGDPVNWDVCSTPSLTTVCIEPIVPEIAPGFYPDLFNFCLTEISSSAVPQAINVIFWTVSSNGQDSMACDTTLFFDCPITEIPCSFITNENIVCDLDSSKYVITVDVQNISNPDFTAEYLSFLPTTGLSPNPVPLVPPLPNDGSMRTVSFCYTPTTFPDPDNELVLVYRLKDLEGDSCCNGNVMIFDTQDLPVCMGCDPQLLCPDDIVLDCCGTVNLPEPMLTDTCGGHIVTCVRDDGLPLTATFSTGITTITCTGLDAIGNALSCSYTVTVLDDSPPSFTCPADLTLMGDAACLATLEDLTQQIQVTDNCSHTITQSPAPGTVLAEGVHMVTITAVDDCGNEFSCIVSVTVDCGQQQCECGGFSVLQIINPDGSTQDVTCGTGVAYQLDCPVADRSLYYEYSCPDQSCPWNQRLFWELTSPSGVVTNGFVNNFGSPGGNIPLSTLNYSATGNYNLQLTTMCGTEECVCSVEFFHQCEEDCTCEDLESDFYTTTPNDFSSVSGMYPDLNTWVVGCVLHINPLMMSPCDKIEWEFVEVSTGLSVFSTTNANALATFNFISGVQYQINITVVRTLPDGTQCELNYKTPWRKKCLQQGPIICNPDVLINGNFATALADWAIIDGTPIIIPDGGSDGNAYVELSGASNFKSGIAAELFLPAEPEQLFNITFEVLNKTVLPDTRLVVQTHENSPQSTNCGDGCTALAEIVLHPEEDAVWQAVAPIPSDQLLKYISFHLQSNYPGNGEPGALSRIGLDEICIEAVPDTTVNVSAPIWDNHFTLFPNPTREFINIEQKQNHSGELQIQVLDLMGHVVKSSALNSANRLHQIQVSQLPPAVYLIKVQSSNGQVWNNKFIKQ